MSDRKPVDIPSCMNAVFQDDVTAPRPCAGSHGAPKPRWLHPANVCLRPDLPLRSANILPIVFLLDFDAANFGRVFSLRMPFDGSHLKGHVTQIFA